MQIVDTGNPHLFGYIRSFGGQSLLMLNNFAEQPQFVDADHLRSCGVKGDAVNLLKNEFLPFGADLQLQDHQAVWLDISGT
jgi:amylosucrase